MTARSVSWTDPRKVAALLAQVSSERPATRAAAVRPMGAILPPKSRGGASKSPVRQPVSPPPEQRAQALSEPATVPATPGARSGGTTSSGGALAQKAPAAKARVPERLVHTSDNPSDRIDALVVWVLENYPCSGAFLADDNGLTLAAHGITEAHVSIVGPLLSSLVGIRSVPGVDATAGALWLGAQMMSWVEVRTERGGFCLGAVGDEALPPLALTQLKEALSETLLHL